MSTYEIRTFTPDGEQDRVLAGIKPEFTDEFLAEGMVKVTLPQVKAEEFGLGHYVEAAVFRDGIEVEGSRAILAETTGNESSGDDGPGTGYEATWAGKTLLSRLKGAIVYPAKMPVDPDEGVLNQAFHSELVGKIFASLFDQAKQRGAIPMITRTTWGDTTDSSGQPWAHKATLEYRPGVTLLNALESLSRMGAVEWRMVGRDLRLYNIDGVGRDLTVAGDGQSGFTVDVLGDGTFELSGPGFTPVGDGTFTVADEHARAFGDDTYEIASQVGALPVVLRRGQSVVDTPYSESTDEVYNTLLMVGDEGSVFEKSDPESVALYGRVESSLSNEGMKDDALNSLAESSLVRNSMMRGEYTCKIEVGAPGPVPWVDFNLGDWVFLDRRGENERYRVRQMSLTWESERYVVVVTLNDKFAELDLKTAKQMEGIIGGAVRDNLRPVDPPAVDRTIPKPPTGVASTSETYTDPVSGVSRAHVTTYWNRTQENTDGTIIRDLSGYDVEERISSGLTYLPSPDWYPAQADKRLQSRWDRRGKDTENNWFGADGGSSVRAANGEDWFFWSDTMWGKLHADGTSEWNSMPRSSITKSDPTTLNDLRGFAGRRNLLTDDLAYGSGGWGAAGGGTATRTFRTGGWGANGNAVVLTVTAAGSTPYSVTPTITVEPGKTYLLQASIDPESTTPKGELRYRSNPSMNVYIAVPDDGVITTGPSDTSIQLLFAVANPVSADVGKWAAMSYVGVYQTDHALQTWAPQSPDETVTNEVSNPDGRGGTVTAIEARRNYVKNPVAAVDLTDWSAYGAGSTISKSDTIPGGAETGAIPEIVNPGALTPWFNDLAQAATKSVGYGVIGDSGSESTGDPSNPDLSDRFIERLQLALRKDTAVPGIPIQPEGYHGAASYIPAWYVHDGGPDWTFESADDVKYPLAAGQAGFGPGGRFRNLNPGHRAHFTARFDRVRIMYGMSGWGRIARITIDGSVLAEINTYGSDGSAYWTSPVLPAGEHTVVVEYMQTPGLPDGSVTLMGADIWEGDQTKGVRGYDFARSGMAAQDLTSGNALREIADDLKSRSLSLMILMLGFNDYGRDAAWGGPRTNAQFKADVLTAISRLRAGGYSGPVLLVGQWEAPQLTPGVSGQTQAQFRARLREIAQADSTVAYVDLSTVMPKTDYAPWGQDSYYVDGLHPSTKGMERIAEALHGVLQPATVKPRSVQVDTTAANQGVQFLANGSTWAAGTAANAGALVKAPKGAAMRLGISAPGWSGPSVNFTGTGDWQWVSTSATVGGTPTGPPRATVYGTAATPLRFHVSRALITRGDSSTYFDGSGGPGDAGAYSWTGTAYRSESVEKVTTPTGWSKVGSQPSTLTFDPSVFQQGVGSVCVTATGSTSALGATYRLPLAVAAGQYTTVIALVRSSFPLSNVTVRTLNTAGTENGNVVSTVQGSDGWYEVRLYVKAATVIRDIEVNAVAASAQAAGAKVWISELTAVKNPGYYWRGSPFHGGQAGTGVVTSWTGAAHASRSTGTFRNSSSAPHFNQAGSIFHPAAAGGNVSEYVWVTGAVKHPTADRAFVFCNGMRDRALRDNSGWNFQRNGYVYLAQFNLTNSTISSWIEWLYDAKIQWGEASWADGGYLYVYGSSDTLVGGAYKGAMHVMRVPVANPQTGTKEMWNGTAWVAFQPGQAAVIATMGTQGCPTGVRTFNGKWIAVYTAGFMNEIEAWEAPAPQGPWTKKGTAYKFPTGTDFSLKYVPRFHPQMDGTDGVVIAFSESAQNGNEHYGVSFVRGPRGTATHEFTTEDEWTERRFTEASPDYRARLLPGKAYQVRVRARDQSDNVSTWAVGAPIETTGDSEAPPKPDKPVVTTFFRGIRVDISGLSANGAAMPPDFARFTVHVSTSESFEPTDANLVDSIVTRGGITVVSGLEWGKAYYVRVVAWDTTDNRSEPSDPVVGYAERLSDPDLPEDLIDGARHIKDRSMSVENFSVGAFGNTLVPNGNVEDGQVGALPAGWEMGWPRGDFDEWETAGTARLDDTDPISGSQSLRIDNTALSSRQVVSRVFPVTPGDIYYVSAKVRTSRKLGASLVQVQLLCGEDEDFVNGFMDPRSVNLDAGVTDGGDGGSIVTVEGQVEVPDQRGDGSGHAMRFAAFGVDAMADGTAGYTAWVDDVEVRPIVGSAALANASINRAKIRYLAVDDARIASMSVGKLVAGELWADITVSARIMTSKSGQRVELNRDGMFGYNGTDTLPVTEVRADNGGLVSRWFRTNTTGTRIEMGTYGMGANSALMAFFPASGDWQFPPAFGFGGQDRVGATPGIAMHAGSRTTTLYNRHGMNMIAVDQIGGIHLYTGNLLNGQPATDGAPIRINAGGTGSFVDIRSGDTSNWTDPAQLRLDPQPGQSLLAMNTGPIRFQPSGSDAQDHYEIRFVHGSEWMGVNHLFIRTGYGGLRIGNGVTSQAMWINGRSVVVEGDVSTGGFLRRGEASAGRVLTRQGTTLEWDRYGNPWTSEGTARATTAFWVNSAGNIEGMGDWNVPRIKVRAQESYISWNAQGDAYVDGVGVKTFVIDHPVDDEKYLVHSAVEGPTADVFYRGEAQIVDGSVEVVLPDYFTSLTVDGTATVQVTAIYDGEPVPPAPVAATRVKGGRFQVVSERDTAVYWEVTAERARTTFDTEPSKDEVTVHGDGPYTYLTSNDR